MGDERPGEVDFRVLSVYQGQWGQRIAESIKEHAPRDWSVESWAAPRVLPPVIDDPEDYLPPTFEPADLVVALGDVSGLAQLVPDIVRLSGARAVIAPIDRNESLPAGLARQLKQWLDDMGVVSAFPKPFCSLGQTSYNRKPMATDYDDPLIRRFAEYFGKPSLRVEVVEGKIAEVDVLRDAACGCARYVAEHLVGTDIDDSVDEAGMLHHHFPCLASMNKDQDYLDTLMHVSGNILQDALKDEVRGHLSPVPYLRPHETSEDTDKKNEPEEK
jgi:hypothetical protein